MGEKVTVTVSKTEFDAFEIERLSERLFDFQTDYGYEITLFVTD